MSSKKMSMTEFIPFIFMLLILLGMMICMIYFGIGRKVSLKNPIITFRFFDFCFFNKSKLANYSIFMFSLMYVFGILDSFIKYGYTICFLESFIGAIVFFYSLRIFI
jgi:hypothetical protein